MKTILTLRSTVIGSLPRLYDDLERSITASVDLQLKNDIEVISDGEQRTDMIRYFEQIPGLERDLKGLHVAGRIQALEDLSEFVKIIDYEFVKEYLRKIGVKDIVQKTSITGPVTLGFSSAINGLRYYSTLVDLRIYSDLAEALAPIIIELLRRGSYVQIDEPMLSSRCLEAKEAVNIINYMLKDLPEEVVAEEKISIHICGRLSRDLVHELLRLNVKTLSFAFSSQSESENLKYLSRHYFEDSGKKLGLGCISVSALKREDVEDVDRIVNRIGEIIGKIGYENISYIHPDCGLRGMPKMLAELVLQNLKAAKKHYNIESS